MISTCSGSMVWCRATPRANSNHFQRRPVCRPTPIEGLTRHAADKNSHLYTCITSSRLPQAGDHLKFRMTFAPLTKNGLGISSLSGSHIGTGGRSRSVWSAASFTPWDGFPTSMLSGLPPARACASSTSVLPCPTFRFRCMTGLTNSSPPSLPWLDSRPLVALDNP